MTNSNAISSLTEQKETLDKAITTFSDLEPDAELNAATADLVSAVSTAIAAVVNRQPELGSGGDPLP